MGSFSNSLLITLCFLKTVEASQPIHLQLSRAPQGFYTTTLDLGGRAYNFLVDSGSGDSWVHASGGQPLNGQPFEDQYGSGSVSGVIQSSIMDFNFGVKAKCEYGVANQESGQMKFPYVDGIFGLAANGNIESLVDCLKRQSFIPNRVISLSLTSAGGDLVLGSSTVELTKLQVVGSGTWSVRLDDVTVWQAKQSESPRSLEAHILSSPDDALLDTGTHGIHGPTQEIEELAKLIGAEADDNEGYRVPCKAASSPLEIHFGLASQEGRRVSVSIPVSQLLVNAESTDWCALNLRHSMSNSWMLGDVFFQQMNVVAFDYDNQVVAISIKPDAIADENTPTPMITTASQAEPAVVRGWGTDGEDEGSSASTTLAATTTTTSTQEPTTSVTTTTGAFSRWNSLDTNLHHYVTANQENDDLRELIPDDVVQEDTPQSRPAMTWEDPEAEPEEIAAMAPKTERRQDVEQPSLPPAQPWSQSQPQASSTQAVEMKDSFENTGSPNTWPTPQGSDSPEVLSATTATTTTTTTTTTKVEDVRLPAIGAGQWLLKFSNMLPVPLEKTGSINSDVAGSSQSSPEAESPVLPISAATNSIYFPAADMAPLARFGEIAEGDTLTVEPVKEQANRDSATSPSLKYQESGRSADLPSSGNAIAHSHESESSQSSGPSNFEAELPSGLDGKGLRALFKLESGTIGSNYTEPASAYNSLFFPSAPSPPPQVEYAEPIEFSRVTAQAATSNSSWAPVSGPAFFPESRAEQNQEEATDVGSTEEVSKISQEQPQALSATYPETSNVGSTQAFGSVFAPLASTMPNQNATNDQPEDNSPKQTFGSLFFPPNQMSSEAASSDQDAASYEPSGLINSQDPMPMQGATDHQPEHETPKQALRSLFFPSTELPSQVASNDLDATLHEAAIPTNSQASEKSLGDLVAKWSRSHRIAEHAFKEQVSATETHIVGNKSTTGITGAIVAKGPIDGQDTTTTMVAQDDFATLHTMEPKDTMDTLVTSDDMAAERSAIHETSATADSYKFLSSSASYDKLDDDRTITIFSTATTTTTTVTTTTTTTDTTTVTTAATTTTTTTTITTTTTTTTTAPTTTTTTGTTTTSSGIDATASDSAAAISTTAVTAVAAAPQSSDESLSKHASKWATKGFDKHHSFAESKKKAAFFLSLQPSHFL